MYVLRLFSSTLIKTLEIFNLKPEKKGIKLEIPKQILLSKEETIKSFIKSYFDCDSHPSKNRREIELVSESKILIQQTSSLLKRINIIPSISKKSINNKFYWRLFIRGRYAELYSKKIGSIINRKQKTLAQYQTIGLIQGCGKQDMIPLGKTLKIIRLIGGFSIGEIQSNAVYSYGKCEKTGFISREKLKRLVAYYRLRKKGVLLKIIEQIHNSQDLTTYYSKSVLNSILAFLQTSNLIENKNGQIMITTNGKCYLKEISQNNFQNLVENLDLLSNSNICWSQVKNIERIKNNSNFVYDLSIEDNHSFIAEGIIVHNTTLATKLALYYSKRGKKTAVISLDVWRPAAAQQLSQNAEKIKIKSFTSPNEKDPIKIYTSFQAELDKFDIIIIDTAGRHSLDKELINEISTLNKEIKPDYKLLVIQADIGQAAKTQASEFQKTLKINGVVITRMDSTAKAGGALTACHETKAPVFFIGTGEKPQDLETFNPTSFVNRLLDLGDLETLLEKVETAVDKESSKKLKKKLEQGKFDLRDFQEQINSMSNMGNFSKMAEMIPGFNKIKNKLPEDLMGQQENKMKKFKHIINSMTKQEIENPELITKQTTRLGRIAKGSGATTTEVRQLIKQYNMIAEMAKGAGDLDAENLSPESMMNKKQMQKLAKKFGKKVKF